MQFNAQMGRLYSLFGEKAFSNERLKLIWNFTSDLDDNSFEHIVDHMVSNFRQIPLPKDFKEAAIAERNSKADYRNTAAVNGEMKYDCLDCHDLGYMLLKSRADGKELLVRHKCAAGETNSISIPFFTRPMLDDYSLSEVPKNWFVPSDKSMKGIWEKVNGWKNYIRMAENHWREASQ